MTPSLRVARRLTAVLLALLLAACEVVEHSSGDSAQTAVARARAAGGEVNATTADTLAALGTPAGDTLAAAGAPASGARFPVATVASPDELRTLRAELSIPIGGVAAADLRDSFDEGRGARRHEAIDIPAPRGTPVRSAADGRVLKLFDSKAGGLMVYALDASERFILMYGHLDAYAPGLGNDTVLRRGDPIGVVGTTGNAPPTVPHLHFAIAHTTNPIVWWTGSPVNPYPLLAR